MGIIADEVGGEAIEGAEQEHHVVGIHRVMTKMEEDDLNELAMARHKADERGDFRTRDAAGEQLLGVLAQGIEAVEEGELSPLPTIKDFRRGARRVRTEVRRQNDVGVEDTAE